MDLGDGTDVEMLSRGVRLCVYFCECMHLCDFPSLMILRSWCVDADCVCLCMCLCVGVQWDESEPLVEDKYGDATQGHGNFGDAIPADQTTNPELIREYQRADGGPEWDGQDPNELTYEPYDQDPRMKARYDLYEKESRHDDIGMGVFSPWPPPALVPIFCSLTQDRVHVYSYVETYRLGRAHSTPLSRARTHAHVYTRTFCGAH